MANTKLRDKIEYDIAWVNMCSVCKHFAITAHEDMGKPLIREDLLCEQSYQAIRQYRARLRYAKNKGMKNASSKESKNR